MDTQHLFDQLQESSYHLVTTDRPPERPPVATHYHYYCPQFDERIASSAYPEQTLAYQYAT
jgi:hypothetical protein